MLIGRLHSFAVVMPSQPAGRTHSPQTHPSSSSTSISHHSPPMSDEEDPTPMRLRRKAAPSSTRPRDDRWTDDETRTLIDAWGSHHLQLNRSNLSQPHWQQICDTVNAHSPDLHRTYVQCKNRIDTLKKKYKAENLNSLESDGRHVSTWPFFDALHNLIDRKFPISNPTAPSPAVVTTRTRTRRSYEVKREFPVLPLPPYSVPVGIRSKRQATKPVLVDEDDGEDSKDMMGKRKRTVESGAGGDVVAEGFMKLAEVIGGFAEVYERVEEVKQRQMVELEKQRMQFAKDIEIQRMKLFMESQVELEKLKRTKQNSPSGTCKS